MTIHGSGAFLGLMAVQSLYGCFYGSENSHNYSNTPSTITCPSALTSYVVVADIFCQKGWEARLAPRNINIAFLKIPTGGPGQLVLALHDIRRLIIFPSLFWVTEQHVTRLTL